MPIVYHIVFLSLLAAAGLVQFWSMFTYGYAWERLLAGLLCVASAVGLFKRIKACLFIAWGLGGAFYVGSLFFLWRSGIRELMDGVLVVAFVFLASCHVWTYMLSSFKGTFYQPRRGDTKVAPP